MRADVAGCKQAAGRLRAAPCPRAKHRGTRDGGHETGNFLLYVFTFCIGLNAGAFIGRELPSALRN